MHLKIRSPGRPVDENTVLCKKKRMNIRKTIMTLAVCLCQCLVNAGNALARDCVQSDYSKYQTLFGNLKQECETLRDSVGLKNLKPNELVILKEMDVILANIAYLDSISEIVNLYCEQLGPKDYPEVRADVMKNFKLIIQEEYKDFLPQIVFRLQVAMKSRNRLGGVGKRACEAVDDLVRQLQGAA